MVATWLLVGLFVASLGGAGALTTYFVGKQSAYKSILEQLKPTAGTGAVGGITNLLFGDSTFLNRIIVWVVILVVIYILFRLLFKYMGSRKRRNVTYG